MVRISNSELVKLLMENSRRSYVELARLLGVTEAAIRKRVRRLEEEGVIRGYTIDVDPKRLGYEILCFLGLDIAPESYMRMLEVLRGRNEVVKLYSTSGDHNILAECWFRSLDELNKFIKELEGLPGLIRACPAIVLQRLK